MTDALIPGACAKEEEYEEEGEENEVERGAVGTCKAASAG